MEFKTKAKLVVVGGAVVLLGIVGAITCTIKVNPGYVGVVYDKFNGGIQSEVLTEGLNLKKPWAKVNEFTIATEVKYMSKDKREGSKDDDSVTISCKDGSLNADLTFNYNFKADDVVSVQKKYRGRDGQDIINIVLRGQLRGWINEITKNYSTMEVHLTKKSEVNAKLTEHLNKKSKEYGVTFENVTLSETRASKEVQKAIESRQKVSQELERQKLELQKVEIEKEKAKLEAEKKLIQAEGERKANEEKAKGLSEAILKEKAIEKWSGQPAPTMKIEK